MNSFKFLQLLLMVLFLMPVAVALSDIYYLLDIDSTVQKPSTIYPGDQINLAVTLINKGQSVDAEDINLELSLPEGFSPIDVSKSLDVIGAKEKETVVFRFVSSKDITSGTYNLSLKMRYKNKEQVVSETKYLSIVISDLFRISLSNLRVSDYFPHIGDTITVTADVANTGSLEARNVSVELSMVGSEDFSNFIVLSDTFKELGNIEPGLSKEVKFVFKASDSAVPGVYSFSLKANCTDCTDTQEQKFSIHLYGRPELIISGVDYAVSGRDDKKIVQGSKISLSVQLDNLGKEDAKRVIVSLATDDSFIGSKSSYVGEIESDDSGSAIFDLIVSENAPVGYHNVEINISYLDELQREQNITQNYKLYIFKAPEPSPYLHYVFIIIILILLYIILKVIIRQLAIRKL
ncbi:MAG: hypothetical protein J7L44_01740 [Candidatus Diapherotrites archaeon]|nr:hypothetical protein [Candidatus Diapherotrites archaeon]